MGENNWLKVLRTIYEEDIYWDIEQDFNENHPVVEATEMKPEAVQEALAFLSQTGLIGRTKIGFEADVPRTGQEGVIAISDSDRRQGLGIGLTPRGFRVVHQRKMDSTQHKTNIALVILTAGLVAGSLIQAVAALLPEDLAIIISVIILILAILIVKITSQFETG